MMPILDSDKKLHARQSTRTIRPQEWKDSWPASVPPMCPEMSFLRFIIHKEQNCPQISTEISVLSDRHQWFSGKVSNR